MYKSNYALHTREFVRERLEIGGPFVYCSALRNIHIPVMQNILDGTWDEETLTKEMIRWALIGIKKARHGRLNAMMASAEISTFLAFVIGWNIAGATPRYFTNLDDYTTTYNIRDLLSIVSCPELIDKVPYCFSGSCPKRYTCDFNLPLLVSAANPLPFVCPVKEALSYGNYVVHGRPLFRIKVRELVAIHPLGVYRDYGTMMTDQEFRKYEEQYERTYRSTSGDAARSLSP